MFKKLEEYDLVIMLMAIALTCFGVVMVYSASSVMAAKRFHDGFFFLKRQGIFALLGFALMLGTMRINYQFWRKLAAPILLGCIVLLVLVLIALDQAARLQPATVGNCQNCPDHVHGLFA
jgi:cell division protein FtsW